MQMGLRGANITVTTGSGETSAHFTSRIDGHEDPSTQAPEVSSIATGINANPNSLSLAPVGGAKDYLWFTVYGKDGDTNTTTYPTNYTNGRDAVGGGGLGSCRIGEARRELNAASEDPGQFTISVSVERWNAVTLVVHPTGGVTDLTVTETETITAAENITVNLKNMPILTESVGVAEAINPNVLIMPKVET